MVKRKFFVVNEQIVEKPFASVVGKSEVWDFVRSLRKSLGRLNAFRALRDLKSRPSGP
jgi:hypothetical protein